MFAKTNSFRVTLKDLLEVVMDLLHQIKLALQVKILRCGCITFLEFCFCFNKFYSCGILLI